MKQKEKVKTAATAMGSWLKEKITGDDQNVITSIVDMEIVQKIIDEWPALPKKLANQTIEKYGPPNEATLTQLIWYNNGPWKRTIVMREETPHNFPQPHTDAIENVINYKVPPEKFSELAKFDGSVIVERTKGEVSARCDMEAANFISLNLMHEIVEGKRTVDDARKEFGEATSAFLLNRPSPYAEKLLFELPKGDTTDKDEVEIADEMLDQLKKKAKE